MSAYLQLGIAPDSILDERDPDILSAKMRAVQHAIEARDERDISLYQGLSRMIRNEIADAMKG